MSYEEYYTYGFLSAIHIMAGLQGAVLAAILLFKKSLATRSNRFLAMALVGASIFECYDFFYYSYQEEELPLLILYAPIYIRTAIPIGLYFFVQLLIEPKGPMNRWERLWYLPILLEVVTELTYIPLNLFLIENTIDSAEHFLLIVEESIGLLTGIVLPILAIQKINQYEKFLRNNYSSISGKSLRWLRNLMTTALVIMIIWLLSHFQFILGYENDGTYTFVSLGLILFLFGMGYFVILQYPLFGVVPFEDPKTNDSMSKKLSPKTEEYHQRLLTLMDDESVYSDAELTLSTLAEKLAISPGYLSQIINEKENKNFFEFVNR
ncbi:MAG: hypothetical protein ACFB0A_17015, partial [Croceivirga sp.]